MRLNLCNVVSGLFCFPICYIWGVKSFQRVFSHEAVVAMHGESCGIHFWNRLNLASEETQTILRLGWEPVLKKLFGNSPLDSSLIHRAGFSWYEALGQCTCEAYSRTVTRKNGKALFSLSFAENDDVDALKVLSMKNFKSLLECHTITALVAAFEAKAFNGWGEQDY